MNITLQELYTLHHLKKMQCYESGSVRINFSEKLLFSGIWNDKKTNPEKIKNIETIKPILDDLCNKGWIKQKSVDKEANEETYSVNHTGWHIPQLFVIDAIKSIDIPIIVSVVTAAITTWFCTK